MSEVEYSKCADCGVLVFRQERCDYCANHPQRAKGTCIVCHKKLPKNHKHKTYGNSCSRCSMSIDIMNKVGSYRYRALKDRGAFDKYCDI